MSRASGVTVTDLTNGVTAAQLAQSLAGGGVAISNVTFTGATRAAGSFTAGTASIGFNQGVVLSSGNVQTHTGEAGTCSQGVEGPNNCYEATSGGFGGADGGENSASLGVAGDSALDTLSGGTTADAAVLEFDFVPAQSTVHFSYVFSSEEYSDYSNTEFNDVFGYFVNGTNCALVPGTSDPVSVNSINNGNDVGGDATAHHADLFRDNVRPSPTIDSQMDGLTTVLTCTANVNSGQTNHMKIAIADVGDSAYDSAVFIEAGSLVSGNRLTVIKAGNGAGTVTSSPTGIDCGSTCSAQYAGGTMVTLTATPATGSTFTGWSGGGCSGTGTCTVTLDADASVTATFTLDKHTLTVAKAGGGTGTVSSSPAGIDCGSTCSTQYDYGTVVTLTATPAAGSIFTGWSGGGCSGTGTCTVTLDADATVTATFATIPTPVVPSISIGDATVDPEGDSGTTPASFAVTLSAATTVTVTVSYATAAGTATATADYTSASGTLTFAAGETSKTIPVDVVGDTLPEADETFSVNLSSPANATISHGQGAGTIVDDDEIGASGGLFCGTQHRGKCKGLKIKDQFDRPGNASWTFAAYNPAPGHSARAIAAKKKKKIMLGKVTKKVHKGAVTIVFKLTGAKGDRLLKQVAKNKLKSILITRTFTPAGGGPAETVTKTIKLKH